MIDTSKYDGVKGSLVHSISNEEWKKLSPAAQALIADAPLLLAEVKELQRQIELAQGVFESIYDDELEDAEWIRWFCNMEDEEE